MRHLSDLAAEVQRWATNAPNVRALLWYGTQALRTSTPFSDVDAALVHQGSAEEVVASLRQHLGPRVREAVALADRGEAALWVDESLTKVDLRLVASPHHLLGMARSLDVPAPRFVVAIDKDGQCGELAAVAASPDRDVPGPIIDTEIDKFLIGFEAASNAHRRSDGYRFYFEYNLALHRLARLIELARGRGDFLFLPRLLLPKHLSLSEQLAFRELRGTIYLPEAAQLKRRLANCFLGIVEELAAAHSLRRPAPSIRPFLEAILRRDLFYNVRDFADAYGGAVRPKALFRASTLSRWLGTDELAEWLRHNEVHSIIDFRDPAEAAGKYPYPAEAAHRLGVVNLPLSDTPTGGGDEKPSGDHYFELLMAFRSNVAQALRLVSVPRSGATAVHCHAGKDRTGWFCAVVALLLERPDSEVIDDYLRSGMDTHEDAIVRFLELVRGHGGIATVLADAGFSEADRCQLQGRLAQNLDAV
jgi:hypothetical protein